MSNVDKQKMKVDTMMRISKIVLNELKEIGKKGESYSDIVHRLFVFFKGKTNGKK